MQIKEWGQKRQCLCVVCGHVVVFVWWIEVCLSVSSRAYREYGVKRSLQMFYLSSLADVTERIPWTGHYCDMATAMHFQQTQAVQYRSDWHSSSLVCSNTTENTKCNRNDTLPLRTVTTTHCRFCVSCIIGNKYPGGQLRDRRCTKYGDARSMRRWCRYSYA